MRKRSPDTRLRVVGTARPGGRTVDRGTAGGSSRSFGTAPAAWPEHPGREDARGVDHYAAALELDGQLRRLGRQDALCRSVLGTIAATFLDRHTQHLLGFARLGDYARERLGLSARELQDAARVSRALSALPVTASAFERGEVSWTQARLLAGVATRDTEEAWLTRAATRTTRALEALIKAERVRSRDTEAGPAERIRSSDADTMLRDTITSETDSADAMLIDGEAAVRFRIRCPRRVRAHWRRVLELARRMSGEQLASWQAVEAIAAEGLSAGTAGAATDRVVESRSRVVDSAFAPVGHPAVRTSGGAGPTAAPLPDPEDAFTRDVSLTTGECAARERQEEAGQRDEHMVDASAPRHVVALADGLATADGHALDARLRVVMQAHRQLDWQLGRLLRPFADLRLHRALGFTSLCGYVRERLGISPRQAQALIAVERRTWHAPTFGAAYRRGELSLVRALTLLPVLSEEHAGAWVARANAVTVRRLAAEVDWALDLQDTTRPYRLATPPPQDARLATADAQMRAHAVHTGWETIDAEITAVGPATVMGLFRAAISARAVAPELGWRALERLLAHVEEEWSAQPRHRDPVFARDGWRCAVPACSGRRNLHDHHVLFRSHGGSNRRDNRVTVCAWHHLRAIHARTVRAWGKAPEAIRWELGVRASGPPLASFVGDRYLRGAMAAR